ncbi:SLC24A2, partial [Symbiodinium necroappetens]
CILGYHVSPRAGIGTELLYEADSQAAPLRGDQFQGDDDVAVPAAPPEDECGVGDMASSSEDSADEEHPDRGLDEAAEAEVLGNWNGRVDLAKLGEGGTTFKCGRTVTGAYDGLDSIAGLSSFASHSEASLLVNAGVEQKFFGLLTCVWTKVGLAEADITKLKAQGITTLAKVAFCCSYTPGSGDDAELIRALKDALAVEPDLGQKSAFRRLYHEAFSVTTAEMKALVEQTDETAPRRLSVPERAERHTKIAKRLPGLDIRNRLEPSDSLVDACVSLYEQNRLNFIEWDRLTSKEQEATSSSKRETVLSVDASGRLKTEKGEAAKAETTTELLLQFALTRRGIALEMGNLLDFNLHAKWVDRLLCARLDQVPQTHVQTSFGQLQLADRKLFQLLAEKTRSGVQATPSGRPLDDVFEGTWMAPEVLHILQPMPRPAGNASQSKDTRPGPYTPPGVPSDNWVPSRKGKGKGKGKTRASSRLPAGLEGCRSHTNAGEPICYGFNLKTCQEGPIEYLQYGHRPLRGGELWVEGHGNETLTLDGKSDNLAREPQEPAKVQPLEKPMFIEICAGSALLSSIAREAGFDILPIDAGRKVPRAYAHVLRLDLREALTLQFLHNVLRNRTVAWLHFSLPTGTIGRVFRSSAAPLGLPNLQEPLASQVVAANKILDQVAALLQSVAISFPTVGVSVEHPLGSVVWELPAFARLRGSLSHVSVTACFFGAPYNRKTLLVSNRNIFQSMGGRCPGCAHHCKPPGSGFRVDGSYPKAFCEAFVGHVSADCPGRGLFLAPQAVSTLHASRAAAQAQPRATKFPPLISEFAYTVTVRAAQAPPLNPKSCLTAAWLSVPLGARLLRSSVPGGVNSPHQPVPGLADASLASFTFGVYREPSTFLREAKLLRHPFDTCRGLPDGMLKVLHFVLVQGPVGVMRHRLNVLKLWQKWATELAGEEEKLRASLHPDVRAVLGNKRVLLMKKIASSLQWPDTTLWDDLTSGFKLTGSQPRPIPQANVGCMARSLEKKWMRFSLAAGCRAAGLQCGRGSGDQLMT